MKQTKTISFFLSVCLSDLKRKKEYNMTFCQLEFLLTLSQWPIRKKKLSLIKVEKQKQKQKQKWKVLKLKPLFNLTGGSSKQLNVVQSEKCGAKEKQKFENIIYSLDLFVLFKIASHCMCIAKF